MRARAFSLIEVMVSGALLIVGLAASFSAYASITSQLAHARFRSTAGTLAEQGLEELILRFPADPALTLGPHTTDPRFYDAQGRRSAAASTYQLTWKIVPYPKVSTIREVSVLVEWQERNTPQKLEVTTWRN